MGKKSRRKGANGEREVAKIWKCYLGGEPKRNLGQYRESSGRDLDGTQPYCVQIKRTARSSPVAKWFAEAVGATDTQYFIPALVHRGDKEDWLVTLPLEDFLEALAEVTVCKIDYSERVLNPREA